MRQLPVFWSIGFMSFGILSAVTSGSLRLLAFALSVGCLLVGIALDFFQGNRRDSMPRAVSRQNPFLWLAFTYLVVVLQSLWLSGIDAASIVRSLPGGVLVITAAIASHRGLAIHPELLKIGLLLFLATGVVLGFVSSPTTPCRADKCSPLGVLFKGGFTHENMMGWAAVLAAIVLFGSALRKPHRRLTLLMLASVATGLGVLSGARTSLYAGVATALAFAVVMMFQRSRTVVSALVPIACSLTGTYLIHRAQVEDFSTRGRRWVVIRETLDGVTSIFGNGLSAWADLQPQFAVPTSTHSVYGALLIQGGLLALVPFTIFLAVATRRAQASGAIEVVVLLHFIAFQAILETVWEPAVLVQRGWIIIAVALSVPIGYVPRRRQNRASPAHYEYLDVRDSPTRSAYPVRVPVRHSQSSIQEIPLQRESSDHRWNYELRD